METGAEIDTKDQNGDTALIISARTGSVDLVKFFIEKGANPFIKNKIDQTARMVADHKMQPMIKMAEDKYVCSASITESAIQQTNAGSSLSPLFTFFSNQNYQFTSAAAAEAILVEEELNTGVLNKTPR